MMTLDNRWFKHERDRDEQQKIKNNISNTLANDKTIKKLVNIIDEELNQLDRVLRDLDSYECPSWSHKQAHINGAVQSLYSIRKLLTNE